MAKFNMAEPVFESHPEGVYVGQLVEFHDEGYKEGKFGTYRSAYFDISTGQVNSDGEVFFPMRYYVNENAGEQSKTTLFRQAVAGRKLSRAERVDFDPETLLGEEVQVQVAHVDRDGKTYAQIANVMPLPQGAGGQPQGATQTDAAAQNTRWNTQQGAQQQQQQPAREPTAQEAHPPADDSDDLPF